MGLELREQDCPSSAGDEWLRLISYLSGEAPTFQSMLCPLNYAASNLEIKSEAALCLQSKRDRFTWNCVIKSNSHFISHCRLLPRGERGTWSERYRRVVFPFLVSVSRVLPIIVTMNPGSWLERLVKMDKAQSCLLCLPQTPIGLPGSWECNKEERVVPKWAITGNTSWISLDFVFFSFLRRYGNARFQRWVWN